MAVSTFVAQTTFSPTSRIHLMPWLGQRQDAFTNIVHNAYSRLTHDQLVLFLTVRSLPTGGSDEELAARLTQYDLHTYTFPDASKALSIQKNLTPVSSNPTSLSAPKSKAPRLPDLPTELLADILDLLGDWELSKAVGVPTSLTRPPEWTRASPTDEAMLSGFVPLILAADPVRVPPSKLGVSVAIRFNYVHVLEMLSRAHRAQFQDWFKEDVIPIRASYYGRTSVLTWWKHAVDSQIVPKPKTASIAEAMDGASRRGQKSSLDWWLASKLPLHYTETALESASAKNHVHILEWWKRSGLPLKIGRVIDMASSAGNVDVLEWWMLSKLDFTYDRQALHHASMHGKVNVLQWWLESGLQMVYDQDALTLATRHNRPEVLEWWDKSGLPAQYRICDIEEALEDAIGGGEAAREWWKKKGVNFNANDKEWMKLQTLN